MDPAVAAVFEAYPAEMRDRLMALRSLIQEVAADTPDVGPLEETLKWGQVSYLTSESGSGTTVRIGHDKASGLPAMFVNCQTTLLSQYRALYPDEFAYDGNRGVVIGPDPDRAALAHMIGLALTYHRSKK